MYLCPPRAFFVRLAVLAAPVALCSNIWVNDHYQATLALLDDLMHRIYYQRTVLVVNEESINKLKADGKDSFIADYVALKDNDVMRWDDEAWRAPFLERIEAVAKKYDGHLFIVSGGPLGKVLVGKLWDANCRNRYIDFGSSVDPLFRNFVARRYQNTENTDAKRTDPVYLITDAGTMQEINVKGV